MSEHISLIGGEVDTIQILRLATLVCNTISVAEEGHIEADNAGEDGKDAPDQRSFRQWQLILYLREKVVVCNVVAKIESFFFIDVCLSALSSIHQFCLEFIQLFVTIDHLGCVDHGSILVHEEGPAHLERCDNNRIAEPEDWVKRLQTWKSCVHVISR